MSRQHGSSEDATLIRQVMGRTGWSRGELADHVFYTSASVSHWLTERRPIPPLVRRELQRILEEG
jgi:hypothetical protein